MALTRQKIMEYTPTLKTVRVMVEAWGDEVILRELTAAQRDHLEQLMVSTKGKAVKADATNYRAKMVLVSAVDEAGNLLFRDDDLEFLGGCPAEVLTPLVEAIMELNGMSNQDLEAITKNS